METVSNQLTGSAGVAVQAGFIAGDVHLHSPPLPRAAHQLPAAIRGFIGRADKLAALDAVVQEPAEAVAISVVSGGAGVGKTALAVHWSHRARHLFPDGQLYVDLSGFGPEPPVSPEDVLARFLRELGTRETDIPPGLEARASMYRTLMDDRRMLVLLDNAGSADQVRSLLPGTPLCHVLITSRDTLPALVVREGARRLMVDVLTESESVELLRTVAGDRIDAEPGAAIMMAERCVFLPLALRLAAELILSRPHVSVVDLVNELAHQQRLDMLDTGDMHTSVRTVFSWSYNNVPSGAARIFCLWGVHPGRDVDIYATAAMAGIPVAEARRLVSTLQRAHLAEERIAGRYQTHDLLRAYARELSTLPENVLASSEAISRMIDHYLRRANLAANAIAPNLRNRRPFLSVSDNELKLFDERTALVWLEAERQNLLAIAEYAADHGRPECPKHLSSVLASYLDFRNHYDDALKLHGIALRAARHQGDEPAQARALYYLGAIHSVTGRVAEAFGLQQQALALVGEADDHVLRVDLFNGIALTEMGLGRYEEAHEHLRSALGAAELAADLRVQGVVRGNLGAACVRLERYDDAIAHLGRAMAIAEQINDLSIQASVLNVTGFVHRKSGSYAEGVRCSESAVEFARKIGSRTALGYALVNLGICLLGQRHHDEADRRLRHALQVSRDSGNVTMETEALIGLGETLRHLRELEQAAECLMLASAHASRVGNRHDHARADEELAEVWLDLGRAPDARLHLRRALDTYSELRTSDVRRVHSRLEALDQRLEGA